MEPAVLDHPVDTIADDVATVRAAVIGELLTARAAEHTAQLQQLWMALQWGHLHPAEVDADGVVVDYAGWGEPGILASDASTPLVPIAGPVHRWCPRSRRWSSVRRWSGPTTTPASSSAMPSSSPTASPDSGP